MLRSPRFAAVAVSVYLLLYYLLFELHAPQDIIVFMFLGSPFLVIWMVYTVIRYGTYSGKELEENEEWGYEDKDKDSLGMF